MIVLKFGGTSVQDTIMIDRAIDVTAQQIERAPLLVSSAMGKTTDHWFGSGPVPATVAASARGRN